jgi:uncharacterized protein YcbX
MEHPECTLAGRLARIAIYPVKSLDPLLVPEANLLPAAGLEHDRRFAIQDAQGCVVNGKRTERVQLIRSRFEVDAGRLSLEAPDMPQQTFSLPADRPAAQAWLSRYLGFEVQLAEDARRGFPDDTSAPGPTVVSTATLLEVARWFDLTLEEVRLRFRANLEIEGVPAFWEDCLYGPAGTAVRFRVGEVLLEGTNPCQRCVVPSRSPLEARPTPAFSRRFAEMRAATLPPWAPRDRFGHYYRLAVNTRLVSAGALRVRVGDLVRRDG